MKIFLKIKQLSTLFIILSSTWASHGFAALDIQHWQTSNGTRVYFVENHALPMLDLSVSFTAGSVYDTPEKSGVAGMTRHLMKLGAAGLSEAKIAQGFADVGAIMSGSFGSDRSSFSLRTLSNAKEKEASLTLFKQVLKQPDFPEAVLVREKKRLVSSIQNAATQPGTIVSENFIQAIYQDHPYALDNSGTEESVKGMQRQDLVDFYQRYYSANHAVIAMIGDMDQEEAKQIAESLVSGLPKGADVRVVPAVADLGKGAEKRIAHPATQAHVMMGAPGIARNDPDLFPLYVGNYILGGGGFVSRLTEEVREKRGLVYSIYSYFAPMKQRGPFLINFQTQKKQVDKALAIVRETLDQFLKNGVTEKELKAAKANMIGGFPMKIDSNKKILGYLNMIGFYDLPLTYLDDYNDKIAAVTTAQVKAAFNRKLHPEQFKTVIVGVSDK